MTVGLRRRLTRLRYRSERYFYLLMVVVLPVALVAGVVVGAYLLMSGRVGTGSDAIVSVPPVLLEAWAVIDPYLSPEAEMIVIGTLILAVLVIIASIVDRRTEGP